MHEPLESSQACALAKLASVFKMLSEAESIDPKSVTASAQVLPIQDTVAIL